jgi:acetyltransferase-like isoleucine patch superfamily enzyme
MRPIRKAITCMCCLILPVKLCSWLLNLLGHSIHFGSRIGFSFIWIDGKLSLEKGAKIGNMNLIRIDDLHIAELGYIGNLNSIKGPLSIKMGQKGVIGNKNSIYRAPLTVTYGRSLFSIGTVAGITSHHRVDCTRSVSIGNYSTVAGFGSQLWTHAYYHDKEGPGRFRLDGEIEIGNNVYIGSGSILNCGIKIVDKVMIGANSSVSKSLLIPGTYVSQPLRYIESIDDPRSKFIKIEDNTICEEVYERKKT